MKTLTKEEILAKSFKDWNLVKDLIIVKELCNAMQEFSDQQTSNLKLINEKQAELIEVLSSYSTHVVIMWSKELDDDESKDLKLRLWHEIKRIKSEIASLQEGKEKEEKDFKCNKCGKQFDSLDGLAWHKTYKGECKLKD